VIARNGPRFCLCRGLSATVIFSWDDDAKDNTMPLNTVKQIFLVKIADGLLVGSVKVLGENDGAILTHRLESRFGTNGTDNGTQSVHFDSRNPPSPIHRSDSSWMWCTHSFLSPWTTDAGTSGRLFFCRLTAFFFR
jgi:hypothetical protein